MNPWTEQSLVEFESKVAEMFNRGEIKAPVHLSDGNEAQLIEIFNEVRPEDYVFCSWRSHYQCLLKGIPEDEILDSIRSGKSISLNFPAHRFYSSAIVGGVLPQAVGVAAAIKRSRGSEHVWCFLGDMTAETGMAQTCFRYSLNHGLPIEFVVEDNGISVCTNTREVWGDILPAAWESPSLTNVRSYVYKSQYPHAGAGIRVQF